MNRVGETQSRVLPRDFLLLEVNQGLMKSVSEVAGNLLGLVFLGAEDGGDTEVLASSSGLHA